MVIFVRSVRQSFRTFQYTLGYVFETWYRYIWQVVQYIKIGFHCNRDISTYFTVQCIWIWIVFSIHGLINQDKSFKLSIRVTRCMLLEMSNVSVDKNLYVMVCETWLWWWLSGLDMRNQVKTEAPIKITTVVIMLKSSRKQYTPVL